MADYPPGAPLNGGYHDPGHSNAPKRHRDDEYGANKRPAYGGGGGPETVFRFLCDYKIVGGMIGKGGENLKEVQQNTGAFIEVIHEAPPHCTERVFIIASPRDAPGSGEFNAAQIALFGIFDKQLGLERHGCPPGGPFLRMLICASQAGSLIGKSGVTIKELKEQSGCSNIKVLQPDDLPPCGLSSDKLLHITGPPESLRRVLQLASTRLRDSPPKEPPSHEPCKNAYPPAPPMGGPPPGYMGGPPPPGYMPPPGAANAPGAPQY